jgi:hypothetical protein
LNPLKIVLLSPSGTNIDVTTSIYRRIMSSSTEVERSPKSDERTPLLEGSGGGVEAAQNDQASERTLLNGRESPDDEHEEAALLEPPPQPRTKWWYIWRAFWFVLAALVLAFFIKGWIEADDVEVSRSPTVDHPPKLRAMVLTFNYSSTWSAHLNGHSAVV